ncbi:hypothetical protein COY32_00720, partial [candidate division WWE3 bacterium CG_4_10_14_0_2_um_filter_41_14]
MKVFDMELTQRQANDYKKAYKKDRSVLLDRYCHITGVSRNLASKRFRKIIRNEKPHVLKVKKKKAGRKAIYTAVQIQVVRKDWELSGEICGERLHPVLGEYLNELAMAGK